MDESLIEKSLKKDLFTNKCHIGVYARNELPFEFKMPACFVVNTKPRSHPGEHWFAIFYNKEGNAYFFDSYGLPPQYYGMQTFLNKTANQFTYNTKRIQGASNFCGFYCLIFLFYISRDELLKFFEYFNSNYNLNDKKIESLLQKNIN